MVRGVQGVAGSPRDALSARGHSQEGIQSTGIACYSARFYPCMARNLADVSLLLSHRQAGRSGRRGERPTPVLKGQPSCKKANSRVSPNPPMGGVNAGQIGMREPAREKAWASLDRCDPARVFSSRTGPGERSMEAGNRVIVRSDAAGCTRGRGGREFGGVGAVADSAVRRGVEWLAAGPGRC